MVEAPPTRPDLIRTVAWLAGNLLRDEADELLGPAVAGAPEPAPPPPPLPRPPPARGDAPPPLPPRRRRRPCGRGGHAAARARSRARSRRPPSRCSSRSPPTATRPHIRTRLSLNLNLRARRRCCEGLQLGTVELRRRATSPARRSAPLFNTGRRDLVDGGQIGARQQAGEVRGLQLGLVNVARKVRGAQLGLVNVADDFSGVPIGLVSVSDAGGVHPTVWTDRCRPPTSASSSRRATRTRSSAASTTSRGRHPHVRAGVRARLPRCRSAPSVRERSPVRGVPPGGPLSGVNPRSGMHGRHGAQLGARAGARLAAAAPPRACSWGPPSRRKARFYQPNSSPSHGRRSVPRSSGACSCEAGPSAACRARRAPRVRRTRRRTWTWPRRWSSASRRDEAALREVYRPHHASLRQFARRLLSDRGGRRRSGPRGVRALAARDPPTAARGAARAVSDRGGGQPRSPPRARRRAPPAGAGATGARAARAGRPSPTATSSAGELAAALIKALDRLPLDQRVAFVLCELEERTSAEAAALAGVERLDDARAAVPRQAEAARAAGRVARGEAEAAREGDAR